MDEREFYKLIEGRDKNEQARATVAASILLVSDDAIEEDGTPEVAQLDGVTIFDGAVYLAIQPNGLSMIDVMFDDPTDYEYLQMGALCEGYTTSLQAHNRGDGSLPLLSLNITEQDDIGEALTITNCVWSYIPTSADKVCTGIRFISLTENLHFVELSDEQVDLLLDEVGGELLEEEYEVTSRLDYTKGE